MSVLYRTLKNGENQLFESFVFRIQDWTSIPTDLKNYDYLKVLKDLKEQGNSVFENSEVSNKVYQDSLEIS